MPCGRITSDTNGERSPPSFTLLRVKREVRGGSYSDGSLGKVVRPLVESPAAWAYTSERAAQSPRPPSPKRGGGASAKVDMPIRHPIMDASMCLDCAKSDSRDRVIWD
jgi:hypothetical protein